MLTDPQIKQDSFVLPPSNVTAVGTHNLILGSNWLKAYNPKLDWTTSRLTFTRCLSSYKLSSRSITILSYWSVTPAMVISRIESFSDIPDHLPFMANAAPYFILQHELFKYHEPTPVELRAKTTHSTTLANKANKNPTLQWIPAQFQIYQSVFSEQASQCLPHHQL
jgi:hypothetical protein